MHKSSKHIMTTQDVSGVEGCHGKKRCFGSCSRVAEEKASLWQPTLP